MHHARRVEIERNVEAEGLGGLRFREFRSRV